MNDPTVSATSLTFLARFFAREVLNVQYVWEACVKVMTDPDAPLHFRDDGWEQDWFLAKYAKEFPGIGVVARYLPSHEFYTFPTFDVLSNVEQIAKATGLAFTQSRQHLQTSALFNDMPPHTVALALEQPLALQEFYDLKGRIRAHNDPAMKQFDQTLAWLHLALGHLFGGIALSNNSNIQDGIQACAQRWSLIWKEKDIYEEQMDVPELIQWKLDVFYGAGILEDGLAMQPSRQGQSRRWRDSWSWLSHDTDPELALGAVRAAARIMLSFPICLFFQDKFRQADTSVTTEHFLAAVVFRRWILQLQAMSWLEMALQRPWQHVRTQDLATFAFSALRPHWPRRLIGLSHRSMDIKEPLSATRAWANFRFSIDAYFFPQWETNVATVWGLFSTTPMLIRVPSEHYEDSVWCRRERELFEYLRDQDDFLAGRFFLELPQHLQTLEVVLPTTAGSRFLSNGKGPFPIKAGQFPFLTPVFTLFPFEPWENRLLACVAAVRLIYLTLRDAGITEFTCRLLATGSVPPPPFILTTHPNGWSSVMKLFADVYREWADGRDRFPVTVDSNDYPPDEEAGNPLRWHFDYSDKPTRDVYSLPTILDLSDGLVDETDVLAAFEWHRTVLPAIIGNYKYGSFFSIDYRGLTEEVWAREERFMVIRGVNRIRTAVPFWYLQSAGQRVDEWKGMGSNPVFTEHVPGQWDWMMDLLDETAWPAKFQQDCKLRFSEKLSAACAATKERGNAYYQGKYSPR